MPLPRAFASRAFWPLLGGLSALVLLVQLLALRAGLESNPFASTPVVDADVYWQWAAAIARGELVGSTPFLSAPLYPYLLGLLRALGLGLAGVLACQVLLHVATGVLLALAGRRAFGSGPGLLAALLFFLLADPAYYTARVLSCTTVVFLSAALLAVAQGVVQRPSAARCALLGATLGLACLSHPPMLVSVPLFVLWAACQTDRGRWLRAGACLAVCALFIAPATWHNLRACGELIPISAQAGITFYHGNQPGSDGTYSVAAGVSTDRLQQNIDAVEQARRATGEASWKAVSGHFFSLGLETWTNDPGAAVRLFLRKAYWFLTGRVYGDIYQPALEHADGLPLSSRWAPLPVALLTWPALAALLLLLREPRRHLPLVLVAAVPLLVVCIFWYSPRYRIPAVPTLTLGAAYALNELTRWRVHRRASALLAGAFVASALALMLNPRRGFDAPSTYRAQYDYTLGNLHSRNGDLQQAQDRLQRARDAGSLPAAIALADVKRTAGDLSGAIRELRAAVERVPDDAYARRSLGTALAQAGRHAEARAEFERSLTLDPNNWEAVCNQGNVLRALGDIPGAIQHYERAIALNPDFGDARYNLALTLARNVSPPRTAQALEQLREALRRAPANAGYRQLFEALGGQP